MALVRVKNSLDQIAPKTYLASTFNAGGTVVNVDNVSQFSANWAIQVGETGDERTEVRLLSSSAPSGTALHVTSALTFDHPSDTPVYAIKYDKTIFKVSTAGTAGTATAIAGGTVNYTPDSQYTQYDYTVGQNTYAYKASFYNSVTAEETGDSGWQTPAGFSFYSLAGIRKRVRDALFDSRYIKDDDTIDSWINSWLEIMHNDLVDVNKDYSIGTVDVSFGTDGLGTITNSDFMEIRKVDVSYGGTSSFYTAQQINQTQFDADEEFNDLYPHFYYFGNNVIGIKPANSGGTARTVYYTGPTFLANDTDELPLHLRRYSTSFVQYALYRAQKKDDALEPALDEKQDALGLKTLFKKQMSPRHRTGMSTINIVGPIDGEDTW